MSNSPPIRELLIVSLTPQNFERGDLWFSEHAGEIKKAMRVQPWWRDNALLVETDLVLKPSEFSRKLVDFGYERAENVRGKGSFAPRGGMIELWPLNTAKPFIVEFRGNIISEIRERPESEEKAKPIIPVQSVEKLREGSFVVHVDHGIGIFRGTVSANYKSLTNIQITNSDIRKFVSDSIFVDDDGDKEKYYLVEYARPHPGVEADKLFVPISQKDRIQPYVGFDTPRVHRLGGSIWQTTKKKAREDVEKLARELLQLYAKRDCARRSPHEGEDTIEEFVKGRFQFTETEDQLRAEEEILRDLAAPRPMDRVLCGDVGFGKTEIALRAVLRAMTSGRQVAILAPTTILAAQHEETFRERLQGTPLTMAMLSRLTSPADDKKILAGLASGTIDGVIGTHRILSSDITFKNLGLVIIDEEQRFGVKQKEKFKSMRSEVDILSLSATPIPRTLSLALAKLRDISRLSTPPRERISIATLVLPYSKKTVKKAIEFELDRGGQIYFLHNRIETIGVIKKEIEKLVKNIRVEVIHGRMGEKQIMRSMDAFRKQKCDVLLATTIIENGLDISTANTLIVDEATRLGLAEAHQLRGRIGRGKDQAFAYFFYPHTNRVQKKSREKCCRRYGVGVYRPNRLTEKAEERLAALREYSELGSGYEIALRDLEIRGAGNILGREQSGTINKIGLNLYYQMLAEAIEEQKSGSNPL